MKEKYIYTWAAMNHMTLTYESSMLPQKYRAFDVSVLFYSCQRRPWDYAVSADGNWSCVRDIDGVVFYR
jgi:hypothetical protein